MSEQSRVEDLLKTGVEEPVLPMSRLEAILRGEKITPQSRVEELLLQYNPSDILIEKRITANGTYFAVNDNADGYFKVVVDTPVVPPTVLDHLVETITENGTYTYTPEHDGFENAEITVAVPIPPEKILGTKTITENGTYDASDDSTEVSVTLDNPSIPDNSFIHVDISDIADVTKIVGKVSYTMTSVDRAFTVDISNIPTYTPSGSNPYRNMYRFDSYNAHVSLYISKDATGIFLYNMNEGWVRPVIYEFGYNVTKQLDGYSEVTVNVSGGADDHIYLMDGQVPGDQGTTYLEFDKPPINGYYVISIYSNNKSMNNMVWFQTGQNSRSFDFSPSNISVSYNCYIMWDNNKATLRIACNSGSWYAMHVRVTRVDDNYILNS